MSLQKIQKDLDERDSAYAKRKHDETPYNEWRADTATQKGQGALWGRLYHRLHDTHMRATIIGALIVAGIALVAIVVLGITFFQRSFFMAENVQFTMTMPENVESNRTIEVVFAYHNDNRAVLHDAVIDVSLGQYFIPEENQEDFTQISARRGQLTIGAIGGKEKGEIVLTGHYVAPKNEVESIAGILKYTPERTSISYTNDARSATTITSSPLAVDITTEKEAVNGNLIDLIITYRNTSTSDIEDVQLIVTYPEGFLVQSTNPQPRAGTNNIWPLAKIPQHSTGEVRLRGVVSGAIDSVLQFTAQLGMGGERQIAYVENTYPVRIIPSPLRITQNIVGQDDKDVVYAGDTIEYDVSLTNQGDIPLRDVIVTMHIDGDAVAYEEIALQDRGFYDDENHNIIWKASDVPALATMNPGATVDIQFRVPVRSRLPVEGIQNTNFAVTTIASLESLDLPSAMRENKNALSHALVTKVGAKVLTQAQLTHLSGPLPPEVGKETTYRLTLEAGVVNNDLQKAQLIGGLQTGTTFIAQDEGDADSVEYNKRTNLFTWNIGNIAHGTGVTRDYRTTFFDIAFTPSVNQVNTVPVFVKNLLFTAEDTFTDNAEQIKLPDVRLSDVAHGGGQYVVAQQDNNAVAGEEAAEAIETTTETKATEVTP